VFRGLSLFPIKNALGGKCRPGRLCHSLCQ
jgi:hypothetical protein